MDKYIDFDGFKKLCERIVSKTAKKASLDEHIGNKSNPHGVTKSQVGLGNVPNVATNNQTPTYTAVETLAKLVTGEKLGVAFGKIAKAVDELITHLADNVRHVTAEERTSWNGKAAGSHTHTASEVGALTNIKIGTVTTGAAGSSATASASTSGTETTLNLTIPKGDKGDTGAKGATGNTGATGAKGDKGDTGLVYGTCSTVAATAAKTVTLTGFALTTGSAVVVKFTVTNTAVSPTLNVNGTGAFAIRYKNAAITAGYLVANKTYLFAYDGTYWQLVGDVDTNTTYSAATQSKAGLMSAADKKKVDSLTETVMISNGNNATITEITYNNSVIRLKIVVSKDITIAGGAILNIKTPTEISTQNNVIADISGYISGCMLRYISTEAGVSCAIANSTKLACTIPTGTYYV